MRGLRLLIIALVLGINICGCKKDESQIEQPEQKQTQKEAAMGIELQWLGHASFKISSGDDVIYIDPWKLAESPKDATLVLVSHSHHDHYSPDDIEKVSGDETKLIASVDVVGKQGGGEGIMPGLTVVSGKVRVSGVAAYNPDKEFHPKANNWVGFIIEVGSKRIYYAGDTGLTEEMKALSNIDVALLPVGGKYTMDAAEAAEAARNIKPKQAVAYHWGDIIGSRSDAEKFASEAGCDVKILTPGEAMSF